MNPTTSKLRNLTLAAAALLAALPFAGTSEAAVRVRVGVRVGPPVARVHVTRVCPGPGYVLADGVWVTPPYRGAVWVAGHYRGPVWIAGHWRAV